MICLVFIGNQTIFLNYDIKVFNLIKGGYYRSSVLQVEFNAG